jgi:hypothetical protein
MTKLSRASGAELTNEERQVLLRFIEDALQSPRYPLSPEVEALRSIAEKLEGEDERKPGRS